MSHTRWIGVDLDGTLAYYDHWRGVDNIGPPLGPMRRRVLRWLEQGKDVRIFTARIARDGEERAQAIEAINTWCHIHFGQLLPITNVKDMAMIELWDDRCTQVPKNNELSPEMDKLFLNDPLVNAALQQYLHNDISYVEALELAVVILAAVNEQRLADLVAAAQNALPPRLQALRDAPAFGGGA